MASVRILIGWNVDVQQGLDGEGNVQWSLRFIEKGTGNVIQFDHTENVKDFIVGRYTGGIVLGGQLPQV